MATTKKNTVELATELAQGLLREMEMTLWDVTYAKEGSVWILRYFVDKEGGINICQCEDFSRAIEKILDDADPVEQGYTLEVSSPGVERELTHDWHYGQCVGEVLHVRLIRAADGKRDFFGELLRYQDGVMTLALDEDTQMELKRDEAAFVRLHYEF